MYSTSKEETICKFCFNCFYKGPEDIAKYDEDELLVKLVNSYRFLWDPLTKGYKDNDEKKRAWGDISAALNKDGMIFAHF